VGATSTYKTKIYVNEEVMGCDLKIAIGTVIPHSMSGFSGGGKIILPGVSSFETIGHNHRMMHKTSQEHQDNPVTGMGIFDDNPMRADIDEAAKLAGLDVLINCIANTWGETVAIFAGAMEPAYAAAVQEAKTHYLTPTIKGKDIVIANTFTGARQMGKGLPIAYPAVNKEGGDIILVANSPEGPALHYLYAGSHFGRIIQAKQGLRRSIPQHINHLIIYTEYPDAKWNHFEEPDKALLMYKWDDVLKLLQKSHGADTKVAVYPNAEIQYCAQ
jgi:nickel-dependent lactate racemase